MDQQQRPFLPSILGGQEGSDGPPFAENVPALTKQEALYVRAVKKLEKEGTEVEIEFAKKVHALEVEFQSRFKTISDKRADLIQGAVPVTEEDVSDVPLVYALQQQTLNDLQIGLKDDPASKGIPNFWSHVLRNCAALEDMIEEHDIPVLKHLKNLECNLIPGDMGFVLRFTFEPNEFFSNSVIEKSYHLKLAPSEEPPYLFEGPVIDSCKVTPIEWHEGKNPSVKLVKRKQKKAKSTESRFVTKQVPQKSFFNFLTETKSPDALECDFEIASLLREQIIPHASLYFTGEMTDDDMFSDYEDDSEEDVSNDDEDDME